MLSDAAPTHWQEDPFLIRALSELSSAAAFVQERGPVAVYGRWYVVPLVLVALGLGSLLMLAGRVWIGETLIFGRFDQVLEASEIQTRSAVIHVLVEELVTGDTVDPNKIDQELDAIDRLLRSVLAVENGGGWRSWFVPGDRRILDQAGAVQLRIEQFEQLSARRRAGFDAGADIGIGSPMDIEYDEVFENLLGELQHLDRLLRQRLELAVQGDRSQSQTMMLAWIAIVTLAVAAIWSRERKRQEAELALRHSEALFLQAQKMEAVGRLAGGMAHDINNHLAAITMQCEVIRREAGAASETRLDAIISTAAKSSELIKRLLAFSRRQPIQPQQVDLNRVLADLDGMLCGLLTEDVVLEIETAPEAGLVLMDPTQIEQIVLNLVVNAREAMPDGGLLVIRTALRPNPAEDGRPWIALSVEDSGAGIPPAIRDRIFEPFFTTKDRATSSGLGLATIDGILRQNGGRIVVESENGKGTTFTVLLPKIQDPASAEGAERAALSLQRSRRGIGILLVEDNDALRLPTAAILASLGYAVRTASDGAEAIARFQEHDAAIELLVTDVIMPGMDGKALADELLRLRPDLQVLFVSSFTDDLVPAIGAGGRHPDILQKPFTVQELAGKLAEMEARRFS